MSLTIAIDPRQSVLEILPKRAKGAEIGVWKGEYSQRLLRATKPKQLHLIDPWVATDAKSHAKAWYGSHNADQDKMDQIAESVRRKFDIHISAGAVTIHRGKSVEILEGFEADSLDWVYIDGDHSYEGAKADLDAAMRVVRKGGVICCDDYSLGSWWGDGVVKAVHNSLNTYGLVLKLVVGNQVIMKKLDSGS